MCTGSKVNNYNCGQNFMNNRILKNKTASNLHCQICSKKVIFLKNLPKICSSVPVCLNILAQNSNIVDMFYK